MTPTAVAPAAAIDEGSHHPVVEAGDDPVRPGAEAVHASHDDLGLGAVHSPTTAATTRSGAIMFSSTPCPWARNCGRTALAAWIWPNSVVSTICRNTGPGVSSNPVAPHRSGVDPDVDAPELLDRAPGQYPHRYLVADVGGGESAPAPLQAFADHLVQCPAAARRQHDVRSASGEGAGHASADAAGGAGDDDGLLIPFATQGLRTAWPGRGRGRTPALSPAPGRTCRRRRRPIPVRSTSSAGTARVRC
jgi:hypothetical protein